MPWPEPNVTWHNVFHEVATPIEGSWIFCRGHWSMYVKKELGPVWERQKYAMTLRGYCKPTPRIRQWRQKRSVLGNSFFFYLLDYISFWKISKCRDRKNNKNWTWSQNISIVRSSIKIIFAPDIWLWLGMMWSLCQVRLPLKDFFFLIIQYKSAAGNVIQLSLREVPWWFLWWVDAWDSRCPVPPALR